MARRRGTNYQELEEDGTDGDTISNKSKLLRDDSFTAAQFDRPKQKIPWLSIAFITFLFILGLIAISISCMIFMGIFDSKYTDRFVPLLVLGSLMFIPGAYYFRIIILVFLRCDNYTVDDIPEFNN